MRGDKMISTSFLSIKDNLKENILKLDLTTTDFLHVDIMDGCFVDNNTASFDVYEEYLKDLNTPLDVHLMVNNPSKYIPLYAELNTEYIVFHVEVHEDIKKNLEKFPLQGSHDHVTHTAEPHTRLLYLPTIKFSEFFFGRAN